MTDVFRDLGLGALFAWVALPLLLWTVRRKKDTEAASRQQALLWVLALDVALFALPFARRAFWAIYAARESAGLTRSVAASPALDALRVPLTAAAHALWGPRSLETPLVVLGGAWCTLTALGALRTWLGARRLVRARQRGVIPPVELTARVDALARQLGIRPPYVVTSRELEVPFVTGLLRPTLVFPERLMASLEPASVELALRHELVHLARLDHLRAALVSLLRLPLSFHPAAAQLHAEYALAREEAVDAQVAPNAPQAYARLLVDVAEFTRFGAEEAIAVSGGDLARRITRLTDGARLPAAGVAWPVSTFALLCAVLIGAPHAAAQASREPEAAELGQVIQLDVGSQKVLSIPNIARVAVGDPSICDLKTLGGNQLLLIGAGEGKTTVLVWKTSGERVTYTADVRARGGERTQSDEPAPSSWLTVDVGGELRLVVPHLARVATSDPRVVGITTVGDEVHVAGREPGKALVLTWDVHGQRSVASIDVRKR